MLGFNYTQLFAALQAWPVKQNADFLANLNRMIFMGELRLIRDIQLDIFDVNDSQALTAGQTILPKPAGSTPIVFTAPIAQGASSATLANAWGGTTGVYVITFSDNEIQAVTLTNEASTATWPLSMAAAVTANATLAPLFVVEQSLQVVYSGVNRILRKRSWEFLQLYQQASPGMPLYYADVDTNNWIIAPATDPNATAVLRKYTSRPVSIVAAGTTWLGDTVGEVLFAACLMEAEMYLKVDDRYNDMKIKYQVELLPAARDELISAWRKGSYAPLQPIATLPQPSPQAPPPQAQQGQA
jgi:hypothetical protein